MTVDALTTLIGSVGFPIVCSVYMMYFTNTTIKDFRQVLENNTIALTKLTMLIKKGDDENEDK